MPITSSLGVGSGLDLSSLLEGLKQSEQSRLNPLKQLASSHQTKLSAYGALQSAAENVKSAAEALGDASLFDSVTTGGENTAFSASVTSEASAGRYNIDVDSLARAQSLVADGRASASDPIGEGGTITLSVGDGAADTTSTAAIDISAEDSSLEGIRDAINAADIGVDASIVNDGSDTPYRLVLTSQKTGTDSQISVQVDDEPAGSALSDLLSYDGTSGTNAMRESVQAEDAVLSVNGIEITSQSNTVEDAIEGTTLNLTAETTATETLSVTRDTDAMKGAVGKFVSAFNQLHKISDNLTAYNGPDANSGVLLGDSTARTVQSRIRTALNTPVEEGAYYSLAQIGVSLQRDGTMEIDDAKLDEALNNNLSDVSTLFTGSGDTKGVAGILTGTLDGLAGENGLLQTASDGAERSIDSVQNRMERMQESIDSTIARYKEQFVQLDSIMAELNSTQSYLSQQFQSLNNQQQSN